MWYNTEPGIPYQVLVVASTSTGRGAENSIEVFFSQELNPSKAPADINIARLNFTSVNVTWTPLTLIEAQGFPCYRVTLMQLSNSNRTKRQTDSITMETTNSYVVFHDLISTAAYSAVVGVRTGSSDMFEDADPITGNILSVILCISSPIRTHHVYDNTYVIYYVTGFVQRYLFHTQNLTHFFNFEAS